MIASVASLSPPAAAALAVLERYKADVVTPLRTENDRLRDALARMNAVLNEMESHAAQKRPGSYVGQWARQLRAIWTSAHETGVKP